MSSPPQVPTGPLRSDEAPQPVLYDPNDPFWRDAEDDDDDMDFVPAESGSTGEDEEGDVSYHG